MNNLDRRYLDIADAEWGIGLDRMRNKLRQASPDMRRLKNVFEDPPEVGPRDLVRVNTHRSVSKIERTYVVEPKDVIDVTMRYQNELSYEDIATSLNLPLGTVKTGIFRAKAQLRNALAHLEDSWTTA